MSGDEAERSDPLAVPGVAWPDVSAVLAVVLAVPVVASGLLVLALLGKLLWPDCFWVIPACWVPAGAVTFVPAFEHFLLPLLFGLRAPTQRELARLTPSWEAVCAAAGVDSGRYRLWIERSRELNAFAAGGRTVAVTRAALDLPPPGLAAILAHELGHHLAGHTRASLLVWWLELPARVLARLVRLLALAVPFVGRAFAPFGRAVVVLVTVLLGLGVLTVLAFLDPWLLLTPLLGPVLAWSKRLGEYRADRMAARLGYGPELIALLKQWIVLNRGDERRLWPRVLAGHPAHIDRITRLKR
ncbi:M48 family metalloprotease [Amycolatopsis australiensis]|uniref:STE24 endopeptidase n=1 Tax=Amycolatopsis australiensis TaxID=546364 RepID=A0A1K1T376_9PSEU|nr:M48 family metalloprotease [Amycolatopsis australiensis]SFW91027.1 STE24 endopeptidase [Amycolatopsis australiensis]